MLHRELCPPRHAPVVDMVRLVYDGWLAQPKAPASTHAHLHKVYMRASALHVHTHTHTHVPLVGAFPVRGVFKVVGDACNLCMHHKHICTFLNYLFTCHAHTHTHTFRNHLFKRLVWPDSKVQCNAGVDHDHIRQRYRPAATYIHVHTCIHTRTHICIPTHTHARTLMPPRLPSRPHTQDDPSGCAADTRKTHRSHTPPMLRLGRSRERSVRTPPCARVRCRAPRCLGVVLCLTGLELCMHACMCCT
jgi:hypothetical protein